MNWSVLWEAVAAIGTMGAVGWAVYTTLAERRKRTEAERELTAEKASSRVAKRREQANHLAIWHTKKQIQGVRNGRVAPVMTGRAHVGNYSSAPIFNAFVSAEALLSKKTFQLGYTNVVPPGSESWSVPLGEAAEYTGELLLNVVFQDVAGVTWRRFSNGYLEEVAPEPSET